MARAAGVLRFATVLVRAGFAFAGFFLAIAMMFLIDRGPSTKALARPGFEESHIFTASAIRLIMIPDAQNPRRGALRAVVVKLEFREC